MAYFEVISHYFHGGIEEKHKNIIQDSWSLDWDLNRELSKYDSGIRLQFVWTSN
jgi:hypothetical protein